MYRTELAGGPDANKKERFIMKSVLLSASGARAVVAEG